MDDETKCVIDGHSADWLLRYIDMRFAETKAARDVERDAAKLAVEVAREGLEGKLEAHNGLLLLLKGQYAEAVPRVEYNQRHEELVRQIADLKESRAELRGKASTTQVFIVGILSVGSLLLAGVGATIAIIDYLSQ